MANGFKRRRNLWLAAIAVLAVVCAAFALRSMLVPSVSAKLDIPAFRPSMIRMSGGADWQPLERDAQGFAAAARSDRYELLVHPATGQVKIRDLRSGSVWSGNPDEAQLAREKVGGVLRKNLESPFILEYYEVSKMQRQIANVKSPEVKTTFTAMAHGVAAHFEFAGLGLQFSMLYELTDMGFQVSIPVDGIVESGKYRILSIDLLPFFGAADAEAGPGYLFVPDGPGALIRFPREQEMIGSGYYQYVYGPEVTNKQFGPVMVSMPVFGIKQGEQAYIAVISEGEKSSAIRGLPSGIVSTLNSVNARFIYREEYDRRLNLGGRTTRVFQDDMLQEDRVLQYFFLEHAEADYVGMAQRYRTYLLDTGQLGENLQPPTNVPLLLTIVGGDTIYYGDRRYEVSTTFAQAEEMLRELRDAGINEIWVTYQNWQRRGTLSASKRMNVEEKLGGKSGLASLIRTAHGLGFRVMLSADLVRGDSEALKLSPKTYGIRSVEGEVLFNREYFYLNPNITYNLAEELIRDAKSLGADGILYEGIGEMLFQDHNPAYRYTREDTAYLFNRILERTQRELGAAGALLGNAYALPRLNVIQQLPAESHQYYALDETVPFYPMAIHGNITYSMTPGNVRSRYEDEFLRAIEYGAVPSFILTAESSRTLMETKTQGLFTSRFASWKEKAVLEYQAFNRLGSVYDQPMTGHRKLREGIYETEYANGDKVVVDYNDKTFRIVKGDSE